MKGSVICAALLLTSFCAAPGRAQDPQDCSKVPDHAKLKSALTDAVKQGAGANSGLGNQQWGTVVNRDGIVCAVVFTGPNRAAEWPGSRLISAEKANTANAFSTSNFALSTANIYAAAQPGGSLYGIVTPPNPNAAFAGDAQQFGQPSDPLVGKPIGGVIVFGGGLPLYNGKGELSGRARRERRHRLCRSRCGVENAPHTEARLCTNGRCARSERQHDSGHPEWHQQQRLWTSDMQRRSTPRSDH